MKYIEEIDVTNKKVVLRLDLNVTIKNNEIVDDTKIKKSIPTIKYLLNRGCNILIMSHLGKIKKSEDRLSNSLSIVAARLEELIELPVKFVSETRGKQLENSIKEFRLTLMENTRFEDYPLNKESGCDEELSKYWASLGDLFINDAFGTSHRCHASNYGIAKFAKESGYGFLIKEELEGLDPIVNTPEKPFTIIMGGAKVDDKVALIEALLKECDYLLVGGGIANTFLKAMGKKIGSSLYSEEYVEKVKELINDYSNKIKTPVDVVVKTNDEIKTCDIDDVPLEGTIYDIGTKTVEEYSVIIKGSNTIFVNGTMGMYEELEFRNGTESLYQTLSGNSDATIVAGGGDAVASVNKLGYKDAFDFLSTGGGATLEYIEKKSISCFKGI